MNTKITNLSDAVEELKSSSVAQTGSADEDDPVLKLRMANEEDLDYVEQQLRSDRDHTTRWVRMFIGL
jgi:hypothetical protein